MAKSNSFFGLRTGSTKSLTFQTYRGQQITKDRVTSVSNPQSAAQMDQRLLLPMVANARTRLAGLVDHSFEGVPYGYQSLQKFSSLNLQKGALTVSSYVPKGLSDPGRANFIISDGSLHSPLDEPALVNKDSTLLFGSGVTATALPSIFPPMPAGTKGSTVMYYLNRFMSNHENLSWFRPNSQLTFLGQGSKTDAKYTATDGTEKSYPLSGFAIMRLVNPAAYPAETTPGTPLTVDELKDYHDDNDKFVLTKEVTSSSGVSKVSLTSTVADLSIEIGYIQSVAAPEGVPGQSEFGFSPAFGAVQEGKFALACACIFSQLDGSVWRRSRTRLTVIDSSKAATREAVIGGYLKSGSESNKYLNTGTDGTGIVGSKKH